MPAVGARRRQWRGRSGSLPLKIKLINPNRRGKTLMAAKGKYKKIRSPIIPQGPIKSVKSLDCRFQRSTLLGRDFFSLSKKTHGRRGPSPKKPSKEEGEILRQRESEIERSMETFQMIKLLATQCATAASSPSRSPISKTSAKSPSLNLRKRRTSLRRLLRRSNSSPTSIQPPEEEPESERRCLLGRRSLKDLFGSATPSPPNPAALRRSVVICGGFESPAAERSTGVRGGRFRSGAALRLGFLRRAWRPALLSIPE